MAEGAKDSPKGRFMIQWQAFFYFPALLFARMAWAHQSWVFAWGGWGQHSVKGANMDKKLMAYPGLFTVMYHMPLVNALCYFMVAQTGKC
jgi:hypothetical protein